jgi:hypothetical protein
MTRLVWIWACVELRSAQATIVALQRKLSGKAAAPHVQPPKGAVP